MMGGLPSRREYGVSMWIVPSLLEPVNTIPYNKKTIPCADQFLAPPLAILSILRVINLSAALALVTYNYDTDTTAIEVTRCERTNTASASGTEVNGVSSCLGKVRRGSPLNRRREDLVAQRMRD